MRISDWSSDVCSSDLVANIHMLIFTDVDGDNPARHIAADSHLILLHVSIVSADISSACQPEIAAYDGQQQRSGEHQHPSAPRRGGWSVCSGRALLNRGSRLLRSEEHTSELQSLMRISYAVLCLKNKKHTWSMSSYKRTH